MLTLDCGDDVSWENKKEDFGTPDGLYGEKCVERTVELPKKRKVIRCLCKGALCNGTATTRINKNKCAIFVAAAMMWVGWWMSEAFTMRDVFGL